MELTSFPHKREKDDVLEKSVCPQKLFSTCYMHRKHGKLVNSYP